MRLPSGKWQLFSLIILLVTAGAFFVSVLIPPLYKAEVSLLFSCKTSQKTVICTTESAGYLAETYAQLVHTRPFTSKVQEALPAQLVAEIPTDPAQAKAYWQERIIPVANGRTGVLQLTVLAASRKDAEAIINSFSKEIANSGNKYVTEIETIQVALIDGPIHYAAPAQPNVLKNTLIGMGAGLLLGVVYVLAFAGVSEDQALRRTPTRKWVVPAPVTEKPAEPSVRTGYAFPLKDESVYAITKKKEEKKTVVTTEKKDSQPAEKKEFRIPEIERLAQKKAAPQMAQMEKKETVTKTEIKEPVVKQASLPEQSPVEKAVSFKEEVRKIEVKTETVQKPVEKKELDEIPVFKQPETVQPPLIKKAAAPDNLPIFDDEKDTLWDTPVQEPAVASKTETPAKAEISVENVEKIESTQKEEKVVMAEKKPEPVFKESQPHAEPAPAAAEKDPTEEEIKERLNKLLRGEL